MKENSKDFNESGFEFFLSNFANCLAKYFRFDRLRVQLGFAIQDMFFKKLVKQCVWVLELNGDHSDKHTRNFTSFAIV